jgi:predicted GTPase
VAADKYGASEVIDPRPFAVGSIAELYEKYPHLGKVVPAMGYYPKQLEELKQTIDKSECDVVVVATPFHLQRLFEIGKPSVKVSYRSADRGEPSIRQIVERFLDKKGLK